MANYWASIHDHHRVHHCGREANLRMTVDIIESMPIINPICNKIITEICKIRVSPSESHHI